MEIPSLYLERIQEFFPDLTTTSIRVNNDGLVNDVVIINDEVVFRFPKHDWAKQALVQEAKILELIRCYVSMPVPFFEHQADDFVMYRLIPGDALHRDDILRQDKRVQDQIAEQLAIFLQELHTIPQNVVTEQGIASADSERSREDWIKLFHEAEQELFPFLMAHAQEWVIRHFEPVLAGRLDLSYEPVLVHGDLGPYHILYDRTTRRINGLIDFGTGGLGDPADDFANIINGLGESFLKRMTRFYPAIQEALDRARFRSGTLEIQWALGGLRSNDLSWYMVHIGRARDMMPVG